MVSRSFRAAALLVMAACLLFLAKSNVQAQDPTFASQRAALSGEASVSGNVSLSALVYSQPPSPGGGLLQSSWWDPTGSDYDQYVWDDFTLPVSMVITDVQWRGGYDPARFGMGGPVLDFTVAIYGSVATQPDVTSQPLVRYHTGGNAGETAVGMFGGAAMFDYQFTLPTPFLAAADTMYWVQIEAYQQGVPDWGMSVGANGTGTYFRRTTGAGDAVYQSMPGDAAFTLLGPIAAPATATPTPSATATATVPPADTPTATATATATVPPADTATPTATATATVPPADTPTATATATTTATPTTVSHRIWFPCILND